jgi:6-phosphogluconate dehydrogenase
MMGAIAEGFNIIQNSKDLEGNFRFDLAEVARVWSHGSIVSGLLMDKAASVLSKDPKLENITGVVPKGETETLIEWLGKNQKNPVIDAARQERVDTRSKPSFVGKVIAAMRHEFGGHKIVEKNSHE